MLGWLKALSLSLSQWLIISLAAVIGYLVIKLKLKNNALHKARVDLLGVRFKHIQKKNNLQVSKARRRFADALEDYAKAKNIPPR